MLETILGAAIPGIVSAFGASKQQSSSQAMAREQMAFQREMSNTAHQRAAKDLEAAGLNRILALGSPASTPGGAMGQAQNILGSGVTSALSGAQATATIRNTKLQGDIIAPEAHRARIMLGIQKAAERKVRSGVKTFGMPNTQPGKGEHIPPNGKFAQTSIGRKITETLNRLDSITNPQPTKSSIDIPANAQEVQQGTRMQHIEQWIIDYEQKHGKVPSDKAIRAEWDRSKKYY